MTNITVNLLAQCIFISKCPGIQLVNDLRHGRIKLTYAVAYASVNVQRFHKSFQFIFPPKIHTLDLGVQIQML